jgi:hypothetical protein
MMVWAYWLLGWQGHNMVNWSFVVICKKCGYISAEKLPEKEAKDLMHTHASNNPGCTIGHIGLMKVRT